MQKSKKKELNPTAYLLVTWADNWADEMDLSGFRVITAERWKEIKEDAKFVFSKSRGTEVHFGTNESNTYDSYDDYISRFQAHRVEASQVNFLRKVFGKYGSGHFPDLCDQAHELRLEEAEASRTHYDGD